LHRQTDKQITHTESDEYITSSAEVIILLKLSLFSSVSNDVLAVTFLLNSACLQVKTTVLLAVKTARNH